ncbi:OsmC-like protein [Heliocybe sulcata]|uniref:OsmC-like protein n=1 Tax=Heliocybe sulcata TaxID=5364 RepID=A0A5C3MYW4_9AGAM|nr:OsmC-like protein [Heliocybe sulcata]
MSAAALLRSSAVSAIRGSARTSLASTSKSSALRTRSFMTLRDHIYLAKATATGAGRNGKVKSNGDELLELDMSVPKAMGGKGTGQNPEKLFAMGYASCFLGALQRSAAAAGRKDVAETAQVHTVVRIGHCEEPPLEGFGLEVEINVEGVDDDEIIKAAHEFCPYSRMLRQGIRVSVKKL